MVLDYSSPTCAADVRRATENSLYYAFDIISTTASAKLCADALSSDVHVRQLFYSTLLSKPEQFPRDDVKATFTFAYTFTGEAYQSGSLQLPPSSADFEFSKHFVKTVQALLKQNKIMAHPIDVKKGGWKQVLAGIDELRKGKVSGKKLVFTGLAKSETMLSDNL
jgi:hypothetical protein